MKKGKIKFSIKIKERDRSWGNWVDGFNSYDECVAHFNQYFNNDAYSDKEFVILESSHKGEKYHPIKVTETDRRMTHRRINKTGVKRLAAELIKQALEDYISLVPEEHYDAKLWFKEKGRNACGYYWALLHSEVNPNNINNYLKTAQKHRDYLHQLAHLLYEYKAATELDPKSGIKILMNDTVIYRGDLTDLPDRESEDDSQRFLYDLNDLLIRYNVSTHSQVGKKLKLLIDNKNSIECNLSKLPTRPTEDIHNELLSKLKNFLDERNISSKQAINSAGICQGITLHVDSREFYTGTLQDIPTDISIRRAI